MKSTSSTWLSKALSFEWSHQKILSTDSKARASTVLAYFDIVFSSVFRGPCNSIWLDCSQLSWSYSTVHVRRRWPGSYWYGREGQTAGLQSRLQSRSGWSRNWSVLMLRSAVKAAKSRGLHESTQNNSQLALLIFFKLSFLVAPIVAKSIAWF